MEKDIKNTITDIKQSIRHLATLGVPTKQLIDATKAIEEELAESKDEKIINNVKKVIGWYRGMFTEKSLMPEEYQEIDAWLEKQGEKKSYASETMNEKGDFDSSFTRMMEKEQKPVECMYSKDNYTDEDRKILCDGCEEKCKFAQKEADWLQELQNKLDSLSKEDFEKVWAKYHQKEEPVSEDLEAEIVSLSKQFPEVSFAKLSRIAVRVAKWQKGRIADIVKQYADKGEKNYQDSYVNDGKCSTSTCYWDGYRDCANGIKRELED